MDIKEPVPTLCPLFLKVQHLARTSSCPFVFKVSWGDLEVQND